MEREILTINGLKIKVYSLNTVIIGSGAAGLNAAARLYTFGQNDLAIVTEGLKMGTSRNTGSDKQTYYKLSQAGRESDSVDMMARTLFDGGSMDGDIALVEAALSTRAFYHLVEIGVPFPHNRFGEYQGYKTDHDPGQRASSAGPLTSQYMTEKLEEEVRRQGIKVFDRYQVIAILTDPEQKRSIGLLALNLNNLSDPDRRYAAFNCTNIIYATGGPAGIYQTSVYPESQTGAIGLALEAGVSGKNLTESQYGIAAIDYRWNLSGSYQQVLPRYISTRKDGSEQREFLTDYFSNPGKMLDAVFLKGYQWPFDPRKLENEGSSLIDLLVYNETVLKGRRVWLDYTKNPVCAVKNGQLDFSLLGQESYQYLKKSRVLLGTPIDRLSKMNRPAVDLFQSKGMDLKKEHLEIAVCAQHNNGGLQGNIWWESNLKHFFPVGEVNGTHGVYRPGGSALNSGQVGSTRAAQYIAARYQEAPLGINIFQAMARSKIEEKLALGQLFINQIKGQGNLQKIRQEIGERMTRRGAHIRSIKSARVGVEQARKQLETLPEQVSLTSIEELGYAFQNYDLLLTQYLYLSAIVDYIEQGGRSRGSYLVYDQNGVLAATGLSEEFRFTLDDGKLQQMIQQVLYQKGNCRFRWKQVTPLPAEDNWFEVIWKDYLAGKIII